MGGACERQIFEDITGIAVPFFFITSGFFFFENRDKNNIYEYLLKLTKTYLKWTIIYLPLTIVYYINQKYSVLKAIEIFVQRFLLVGENYYSFHLWYLHALICCVILYAIIEKGISKNLIRFMLVISYVLYIGGRVISYFYSHENLIPLFSKISTQYMKIFITTRNGLFVGLCFFMVGIVLSENKHKLTLIKRRYCWIGFFSCGILNHYGLFVFLPVEVACLWVIAFNSLIETKEDTKVIRKASGMNYYVHMYPVTILALLNPANWGFLYAFIVASIITIAISTVYVLKKYRVRVAEGKKNENYIF